MTASPLPRFHLAIAVDDLAAAAAFYGDALGCARGRSAETWIDWNLAGHQLVTHLVARQGLGAGDLSGISDAVEGHNPVDGHDVPVPHFGLLLTIPEFHQMVERVRAAGAPFVIAPYLRFAGEVGEQWTMFFHDPAGNAIEIKAFADDTQVFAV